LIEVLGIAATNARVVPLELIRRAGIKTVQMAVLIGIIIRLFTATVTRGSLGGVVGAQILTVRSTITVRVGIQRITTADTRSFLFMVGARINAVNDAIAVSVILVISTSAYTRTQPLKLIVGTGIMAVMVGVTIQVTIKSTTAAYTRVCPLVGIIGTGINTIGTQVIVPVQVRLTTTADSL